MKDIDEYIALPRADRQKHLSLAESCTERGGNSYCFRGLLAYFLDTTIPYQQKIHLCHACHNGLCSNPFHLYWGTPAENHQDAVDNGMLSIWDRMVAKYGLERAREMQSRKANKSGIGNKGKPKTKEHKKHISTAIQERWNKRKYEDVG